MTKIKINKSIAIALAVLVLSIGANVALGKDSNSNYQSGYDHGCADAKIDNSNDWYISQPGKGKAFHTGEFISGYDNGFRNCGGYADDEFYKTPSSSSSSSGYSPASCSGYVAQINHCVVDGREITLKKWGGSAASSTTQAQSAQQHVTCITLFSVCGNGNQQGLAAVTDNYNTVGN